MAESSLDFHFELISPERVLFSGPVQSVVASGVEGQFTILKDHAPFISLLKPGLVHVVENPSHLPQDLFISGGLADVSEEGFILLAEKALFLKDVDRAQVESDLRDLEEDYTHAKDEEERKAILEKIDEIRSLREALELSAGRAEK